MATIEIGEILEVWATDPGSLADFPAWTALTGHELISTRNEDAVHIFQIRRVK
jgi:TusA-related sulfurtransferase